MSRQFKKICYVLVGIIILLSATYFAYDEYDRRQPKVFYTTSDAFLSLATNQKENIANGFFYIDITPASWPENGRDIYWAVKRKRDVTVIILENDKKCTTLHFIPGLSKDGYLQVKANSVDDYLQFLCC